MFSRQNETMEDHTVSSKAVSPIVKMLGEIALE